MARNLRELLGLLAWTALVMAVTILYCRYTPDQLSGEADLTAEAEAAP